MISWEAQMEHVWLLLEVGDETGAIDGVMDDAFGDTVVGFVEVEAIDGASVGVVPFPVLLVQLQVTLRFGNLLQ